MIYHYSTISYLKYGQQNTFKILHKILNTYKTNLKVLFQNDQFQSKLIYVKIQR